MLTPRLLALLLVAAFAGAGSAFALAACGGDDETATDPEQVEEAEQVEVALTEFELEPDRAEVRAGAIEFVASNEGDQTHAFAVETSEGEVERTGEIAPGETERITVDLRPGTYDMYDPLEDFRTRGMEGVVEVEERERTVTEQDTVTEEETVTEEDTVIDEDTETETRERTVTEQDTVTEERTVTQERTVTTPTETDTTP